MSELDDLENTARAMRDQHTSLQVSNSLSNATTANPDAAAENLKLGRRFGVPTSSVAADPSDLKRYAAVLDAAAEGLPQTHPVLAQHVSDQNTANVMHDDVQNAKNIETSLTNWNPSFTQRAVEWFHGLFGMPERARAQAANELYARGAGTTVGAIRSGIGMSEIPEQFASKAINTASLGILPDVAGEAHTLPGQVSGAAGTFAGFLAPAKGASYLLGASPLAPMLEHTAGESFAKAIAKDVTAGAITLSAANTAVNATDILNSPDFATAMSKLGQSIKSGAEMGATFGVAGRVLPDNSILYSLARAAGVNAAMDVEQGKTPYQDLANWHMLDDSQKVEALFNYGLNTFFSWHGQGRVQGGWFKDAARADSALQDAAKIETVTQHATESKWRARDDVGFKNFIQDVAPDGALFVKGAAFAQAMQEHGVSLPELQAKSPEIAKQLAEATSTADIRIPMADYMTHIAGSKFGEALKPELKTDPGPDGMTYSQAIDWYSKQAEQLQTEAAAFAEKHTADTGLVADRQAVYDDMLNKLNATGLYAPDVAKVKAALYRDTMEALGSHLGVSPLEAHRQYGMDVEKGAKGGAGFEQKPFGGTEEPKTPLAEGATHIEVDGVQRHALNSEGRPIHATEEGVRNFWRWFGDSKVVDDQGRPLVVYHGTDADFEVFNPDKGTGARHYTGVFTTANPHTASTYASGAKGLDGLQVMPLYIRIEKPVKIDAAGKNWNNLGKNTKIELPDLKVSNQADEDLLAELEGREPSPAPTETLKARKTTLGKLWPDEFQYGDEKANTNDLVRWARKTGYEGVELGAITDQGPAGRFVNAESGKPADNFVIFDPAQVKSAIGNNGEFNPTEQSILKQSADLLIQHNLTEDNLLHAVKLGGIPVPSLAITKKQTPMTNFGEVTLLGSRDMADPKGYAGTKVFGADIYSPRYPRISYKVEKDALKKLNEALAPYREKGEREIYGGEITDLDSLIQVDAFKRYADAKVGGTSNWSQTKALAQNLLDEAGADQKIFMGFTNLGNRRYIEHNIENVVKILKKELRGGEGFNYGVGSVRAKYTPEFKSIKAIKDAKDRLVDEAKFEEVKREVDNEFSDIQSKLAAFHGYSDRFGFGDTVSGVMTDAAKMGIPKALKENGFEEVPTEVQEEIRDYLNKLRNLPTEYFEAKILRGVDLSEFSGAVVPDNVKPETLKALKDRGITDVRTYKAGDNADRAAKIGEFEHLFFQNTGSVRGFYDPSRHLTTLTPNANLTTFNHELMHHLLTVYADVARNSEAPESIRGMVDTLLKHTGVEGDTPEARIAKWHSLDIKGQEPYHEQIAREFEGYLLTGRAPASELQPIFSRIRAWMVRAYQSLKNMGVSISPEVRQVFDRMVATDAAIEQAERARQFAPIPKPEGVSDEDWNEYLHLGVEATDEAIAKLQSKAVSDMKWLSGAKSKALKELQKKADSARQAVRDEVENEVDQIPVYRAEKLLKTGQEVMPDGSVEQTEVRKLDLAAVKELFPEGGFNSVADHLKGMTQTDGVHPDLAAEILGYDSGEALVRALIERQPREVVVEGLTDQRMLERHGELSSPADLDHQANIAVSNEARARFVATGLKIMTKAPVSARELAKAAKQAADIAVSAKRVGELDTRQYETAEARAHKEVLTNIAKDPARAAAMQRAALLNNSLIRATNEAQAEVDKAIDHWKHTQKAAAQDNMRGEYLEQYNGLLARFDLRTSLSRKEIEANKEPLGEWVARVASNTSAVMPDLPDYILNEGYRKHYSQLTVDEFRGLRDALKQLEFLARREEKMYRAIRDMNYKAEVGAIVGRIREFRPEMFDEDGAPRDIEAKLAPGIADAVKNLGDKFAGEMLNAETIISILDGGTMGQVHESLFGRISDGSNWKVQRMEGIYKEMKPLYDQWNLKEKHDYARKDIGSSTIGMPLTRENALVTALLHGSEDGRSRLENYGWTREKQAQIIDLLDARDVKLANAIWRLFDKNLWPELDALNMRTKGKSPPKVEAAPHTAKGGELEGGYFRLKYDTDLDERAFHFDEGAAVQNLLGGGMGMSAKTAQGSSIKRMDSVKMRPRLDLGVFAEAVNETVHDLAYREAVADTIRLLNNKAVMNSIKQTVGIPAYRALVNRVREIAAPPRNPMSFIEKSVSIARKNTVITLMSGVNTALQNITGVIPAFTRVNAGLLTSELGKFFSPRMKDSYDFVMQNSTYMHNRNHSFDRDMNNMAEKLTVNGRIMPDTGAWLKLMSLVDRAVSIPVWKAAYREGMGKFENDHAKSVEYADYIVRQTQGSGRDVDLAKVMSGHGGWGQLKGLFTMFYSYFNGMLNLMVHNGVISARSAKDNPAMASAKLAGNFMAIVVLPAVLTEMFFHPAADENDDPVHRYGHALAMYVAGFFPIARDLASGVWSAFDHDVTNYGYRITPAESMGEGVIKGAVSLKDIMSGEGDEHDTKNVIMGAGFAVGLPSKLISDTYMGTNAWLEGNAGPQAVVLGPPKK